MPDLTDEDVLARYPEIRVDHVNKETYRGYLRHELLAGYCEACLRWHNPLRPRCPGCWSVSVAPRPVGGRGTIHALTLLHQGPPGVPYAPPWPVAAIELAEQPGLRVAATLVDTAPERQRASGPPVSGLTSSAGPATKEPGRAAQEGRHRVQARSPASGASQFYIGEPVELTWIERDGAPWPAFKAVASC